MKRLALLAVLIAVPATAQDYEHRAMQSGSDAYRTCRDYEKAEIDGWVCLGWVNGAVQGGTGTISVMPLILPGYCTPESGSLGQYADVFVKYLRDHPELRHQSAISLFRQAMAAAFPCG